VDKRRVKQLPSGQVTERKTPELMLPLEMDLKPSVVADNLSSQDRAVGTYPC